jgi:ribosome-binding factor A
VAIYGVTAGNSLPKIKNLGITGCEGLAVYKNGSLSMVSLRVNRLTDEIRDILASCFQGGLINDPRLTEVTITSVKLSPDLQIAKVYYRVYNDANIKSALKGLEHATGFLKKALSGKLDLKRIPELKFFYDESIEEGSRIESLLRQINTQE